MDMEQFAFKKLIECKHPADGCIRFHANWNWCTYCGSAWRLDIGWTKPTLIKWAQDWQKENNV